MADHHPEIIFIKRKGGHGGGHHGGAWKIAFADFMTAMMAFFLVLWIINASDKDTKTVIARYFNPVKLENPSRAKKGLHGTIAPPDEISDAKADQTDTSKDGKAESKPSEDKNKQKSEKEKAGNADKPKSPKSSSVAVADTDPSISDAQLFEAPFQSLDRIVNDKDAQHEPGALTVDAFRDPFKPIGPGSPDDPVSLDAEKPPGLETKDGPDLERNKAGVETLASEKSGSDAVAKESPVHGDGASKTDGAARLLKELQQKLGGATRSALGPSLDVRMTDDGVLISLTDKLNFSMFAVGSAEPRAELIHAMESVAQALKGRPGQIVLRGHTDARPYKAGGYDNWRLSSARAQMAYYMLVRGGLPEGRVGRVEGYADRALHDAAHPLAAENRRLEILLREPKL